MRFLCSYYPKPCFISKVSSRVSSLFYKIQLIYYYYKNEWKSWPDFLNSSPANSKKRIFLSFQKARKIVRNLRIKNLKGWQNYSKTKRPINIPGHPNNIYKNKGWKGWEDFLGTKNK